MLQTLTRNLAIFVFLLAASPIWAAVISGIAVDEDGNLIVASQEDVILDESLQLDEITGYVDILTKGELETKIALTAGEEINLNAEWDITAAGKLTTAEGGIFVNSERGDCEVRDMTANGDVYISSGGELIVREDASVSSIEGSFDAWSNGKVSVNAEKIYAPQGGVFIESEESDCTINGVVTASYWIEISAAGNAVIESDRISCNEGEVDVYAGGNIESKAAIRALERVYFSASDGSVECAGSVTTDSALYIEADGDITTNGATDSGTASVLISQNGGITCNESVTSVGQAAIQAKDDVTLESICGSAVAVLSSKGAVETAGDVTAVDGDVQLAAMDYLETQGDITADNGSVYLVANIEGVNVANNVTAVSDVNVVSENSDVTVWGAVTSTEGDAYIGAKENVLVGSDVQAAGGVKIESTCGDVDVQGVIVSANDITLDAEGSVNTSMEITAGASVVIKANEGVCLLDGVNAESGDISIFSDSEVDVHDLVARGYLMLKSARDITISGAVSASEGVSIIAYNDLVIGNEAFMGFNGENFYISAGRQVTIGSSAFQEANLPDLDFSRNYLSIGEYAFQGCTGMKSIDLSFYTEVGEYAFAKCVDLEAVYVPAKSVMDNFPANAFENCKETLTFYVNSTGPEGTTWNGFSVVYEKGEGELEVLQKDVEELDKKQCELTDAETKSQEAISELQKDNTQMGENVSDIKDQLKGILDEISTLQGKIAELEKANTQKDTTIADLTKKAEDTADQLKELTEVLESGTEGQFLAAGANGSYAWAALPTDTPAGNAGSFVLYPGWNLIATPETKLASSSIEELLKFGSFYLYNAESKTFEKLQGNNLEPRTSYWFYLDGKEQIAISYETVKE